MNVFRNLITKKENLDLVKIEEILNHYKVNYETHNESSNFTGDIYTVFIIRDMDIVYEFTVFELCYYLLTLIEGKESFLFGGGDYGDDGMDFEKAAFSFMKAIANVNSTGRYKIENLVEAVYQSFKNSK